MMFFVYRLSAAMFHVRHFLSVTQFTRFNRATHGQIAIEGKCTQKTNTTEQTHKGDVTRQFAEETAEEPLSLVVCLNTNKW